MHTGEQEEGRIVCKCFSLSEPYMRRKIKELNLRTIAEVTNAIKAGGACMACHHVPGGLQDLLDEIWGKDQRQAPVLPPSRFRRQAARPRPKVRPFALPVQQERRAGDRAVRAADAARGRRRHGNRRHQGQSGLLPPRRGLPGCAAASQTLRMLVERTLKDMVDERIRVIQV